MITPKGVVKMSTTIRPKLSAKNKYAISKHRYYELKHFVMQYPEWKARLKEVDGYGQGGIDVYVDHGPGDPTHTAVELREECWQKICMVETAAKQTDIFIGDRILEGVVDGVSFDILNTRETIPCCKDVYYELYRKFFWLLDKARK